MQTDDKQKEKVCPHCKKRQPNRIETVIVVVLIIIGLIFGFIYIKGLLDDLDMKIVDLDKPNRNAVVFIETVNSR